MLNWTDLVNICVTGNRCNRKGQDKQRGKRVSNDSLSIKGVDTGDDVGAVSAHQEMHSFVESLEFALSGGQLCLLDDVQGVWRAHAQGGGVTSCLQTAVWIHAVHKAI